MSLTVNAQKTPVSMLNEMMTKKGCFPDWKLIHDGGGGHENTFTYRVTCDGLQADGTGRSKKDAKHNAAKAMLETIADHNNLPQLPPSVESPVRTPQPIELPVPVRKSPDTPFHNAIGNLKDLCTINHLKDLKYETIGEVGPPHARIFTIECTVSTFREVGIATTKKEAKHKAAKQMLDKISVLVADSCFINARELNEEEKEKLAASTAKALEKYPKLCFLNKETIKMSPINWGLKFIDFFKVYTEVFEERQDEVLTTVKALRDMLHQSQLDSDLENLIENLTELFKTFEFSFELSDVPTSDPSICMSCARLHCYPPIFEIGIGDTQIESKFKSIKNLLDTLINFME